MNNDLISRSELKTALANNSLIRNFNLQYDGIIAEIIDNAPTVEPTFGLFRAMLCETCQAYATNKAIARLKGEWIDHSEEGYVECPFCGHLTSCEDNKEELHYCWNCGAKMEGGAE